MRTGSSPPISFSSTLPSEDSVLLSFFFLTIIIVFIFDDINAGF